MSYTIVVKAESDALRIVGVSGHVPDGTYQVGGHIDGHNHSVQVTRFRPDGAMEAMASMSYVPAPAQVVAEPAVGP